MSEGATEPSAVGPGARPALLLGALAAVALLLFRACGNDDEPAGVVAFPTPTTDSIAQAHADHSPVPEASAMPRPSPQTPERTVAAAQPTPIDPSWLLPDLQTTAPRELSIEANELGLPELRFSTTVINLGDGPLEMVGESSAETGQTVATQVIQTRESDAMPAEHTMGRFIYHPAHLHWHVEDFTQFDLWSVTPDGRLDELYATTGKMSFCIVDSEFHSEEPRNAVGELAYVDCSTNVQGISVGWGDTYEASLPGQVLSLVGVPDGRYALVMTVDPDNRVLETDDTNNAAREIVEISGYVVTRAQRP